MEISNTISVIIPVYNGARYLGEAIESVLAQTRPPDEVIVVDDGSTDDSAGVAQRYPVRLLRQANTGASVARNRGVEAAGGDLLALLDADDLWMPDKLAWQEAWLAMRPDLDMVFGQVEQFVDEDYARRSGYRLPPNLVRLEGLHVGAMLIRRAAWERVGPFRPELRVATFIEWHARAQDAGLRAETLPDVVMRRRIHGDNMGLTQQPQARAEYLQVLRESLARRRE